MNLNDVPANVLMYGDPLWRGKCATETIEQVTFFNRIRAQYPKTYGAIAIHIKNEGKRTRSQIQRDKAEGLVSGASDIIIPGRVTFVCELKRRDHTQSKFQPNQLAYLESAGDAGAFACVALGCDSAWLALKDWIKIDS